MTRLTFVQFSATRSEIHIFDAYKFGTLDDFPEEIEHQKDGQADISGDEKVDIPFTSQEHLESVEQNDDADEKDTEVAGIRLEGRFVG
jgi:hypothetical protein